MVSTNAVPGNSFTRMDAAFERTAAPDRAVETRPKTLFQPVEPRAIGVPAFNNRFNPASESKINCVPKRHAHFHGKRWRCRKTVAAKNSFPFSLRK